MEDMPPGEGPPHELPLEDEHLPEPARQREPTPPDYHKRKINKQKLLLYLAGVVIAAGALGAVYKLVIKPKPAPAKVTSTTAAAPAGLIDAATKNYQSPNFYLNFDYPANWTVTDTGGTAMTVISPVLKLKNALGASVDAKIVLTINQKGQNMGAFDAGNAAAVLDSQKITYTKPTSTQRADTYLSFLQYAKTTAAGALDGIYITGNLGYQKAQAVPKADLAGVDPLIAVSFADSSSKPLSIASGDWNDTGLSGPIKKMLASLAIN